MDYQILRWKNRLIVLCVLAHVCCWGMFSSAFRQDSLSLFFFQHSHIKPLLICLFFHLRNLTWISQLTQIISFKILKVPTYIYRTGVRRINYTYEQIPCICHFPPHTYFRPIIHFFFFNKVEMEKWGEKPDSNNKLLFRLLFWISSLF